MTIPMDARPPLRRLPIVLLAVVVGLTACRSAPPAPPVAVPPPPLPPAPSVPAIDLVEEVRQVEERLETVELDPLPPGSSESSESVSAPCGEAGAPAVAAERQPSTSPEPPRTATSSPVERPAARTGAAS